MIKKLITKLTSRDFPLTLNLGSHFSRKDAPQANAQNMLILMNKVNELTKRLNQIERERVDRTKS